MMNASDIPYVVVAMAIGVVVTGIAFFVLRAMKTRTHILTKLSPLAFPALLIAVIVYVEVWHPDPHGFVMVGLGFLALISLPITILTTMLLVRRFAKVAK